MSQNISILTLPVTLTTDVDAYTFVTIKGTGAEQPGGNALGLTQTKGVEGDTVAVDVLGTSLMIAHGVIPKGAEIQTSGGNGGVVKTTGVTVARALEASNAFGDIIEVLLIPN